jgi:SAM-dependent methyltransferase
MQATTTALWKNRRYEGITSYTLAAAPVWLQQIVQPLFRDAMFSRLRRRTGRRFAKAADLACGVGDWSLRYLEIAQRVVGVDVNPEFLAEARRAASRHPRASSFELVEANLVDFDGLAGVDLVTLGACCQCLNDREVEQVLARASAALLPTRGVLYVRAAVVTPLCTPFATHDGFYRDRATYEELFERHGFRVLDAAYSATVVAEHLAQDWFLCESQSTRAALTATIAVPARLSRVLQRQNDFCNWILERRA